MTRLSCCGEASTTLQEAAENQVTAPGDPGEPRGCPKVAPSCSGEIPPKLGQVWPSYAMSLPHLSTVGRNLGKFDQNWPSLAKVWGQMGRARPCLVDASQTFENMWLRNSPSRPMLVELGPMLEKMSQIGKTDCPNRADSRPCRRALTNCGAFESDAAQAATTQMHMQTHTIGQRPLSADQWHDTSTPICAITAAFSQLHARGLYFHTHAWHA